MDGCVERMLWEEMVCACMTTMEGSHWSSMKAPNCYTMGKKLTLRVNTSRDKKGKLKEISIHIWPYYTAAILILIIEITEFVILF